MEGTGAVQFGNLAQMPQIVIGPFVEHVRQSDFAKL